MGFSLDYGATRTPVGEYKQEMKTKRSTSSVRFGATNYLSLGSFYAENINVKWYPFKDQNK